VVSLDDNDWQLEMGATPGPVGVRFRVWAPAAKRLELELDGGRPRPLTREGDGVWSTVVAEARPGSRYQFRVDGQGPFPDPYSRSQPEGVHGPSEVVEPTAF
jgi:maltooligosyltrehalose trehalohydrolase